MQEILRNYALKYSKEEACGLIVRASSGFMFIPCRNVSPEPQKFFIIAPQEYSRAQTIGRVYAVFHSHPSSSTQFSADDLKTADDALQTILVYSLPQDAFGRYTPLKTRFPLEERPYIYGAFDCFTYIRDYYADNLKITLPWLNHNVEHLRNGFVSLEDYFLIAGLTTVQDLKPGDLIAMALRGSMINHVAVYIGKGQIAHQLIGQAARVEPMREYWEKSAVKKLRHVSRL